MQDGVILVVGMQFGILPKGFKWKCTKGEVVQKNCSNSYLKSENRLLVGLGIDNIIAIETSDAVLIADKKKSQDVKNIVEILKESGKTQVLNIKNL